MTEQEQNERIALLLGWRDTGKDNIRTGARVWHRGEEYRDLESSQGCPDYGNWLDKRNGVSRFPELQEYVRGLDYVTGKRVDFVVEQNDLPVVGALYRKITPTVLRDAILAVVGEEAEVGSA